MNMNMVQYLYCHPNLVSFMILHPLTADAVLKCQVITRHSPTCCSTGQCHSIPFSQSEPVPVSAILYKLSTSPPLPPLTYWSRVCPRCIVLQHICNQYLMSKLPLGHLTVAKVRRCIYSSYGRL